MPVENTRYGPDKTLLYRTTLENVFVSQVFTGMYELHSLWVGIPFLYSRKPKRQN